MKSQIHFYNIPLTVVYLSSQNAGTASLLNLLFSSLREPSGLHNDGTLRQEAFAENLEVSVLDNINHRSLLLLVLGFIQQVLFGLPIHQRPQEIHIDRRLVIMVLPHVEVSHTNFTEITRMVLVEHDTVDEKYINCSHICGIHMLQ